MSAKNCDQQNRWRNKMISFRLSPEEHEVIQAKIRMSGLSKQEYITRRLSEQEIVVQGNPKVYRALKTQMSDILAELQRIAQGEAVSPDLLEILKTMTAIMRDMKESSYPDR